MPDWVGSTRRERLPPGWAAICRRILARDKYRCTWIQDNKRCSERATEVDHRNPGDDHSDSNLRSLCHWHHLRKSGSEGGKANAAKRAKIRDRFRREEPHPGSLV